MKKRTIWIVNKWAFTALIFVLAGYGFAESRPDPGKDAIDEQTLEFYQRGVNLMHKTAHGRFILAGEVVDQDGDRLKDVEIRMRLSQLIGIGWDTKSDYETAAAGNGIFHVDVRPYSSVNLTFKKEGYYDEQLFFPFASNHISREDEAAIMAGKEVTIEEGIVRSENLRIVMEKKGDITDLLEETFKLTYQRQRDGTASGRVVSFNREMWPRGYYYQGPRNPIPATNLLDPVQIPPMCVYMLPKVDEDGRIRSEVKVYGKNGRLTRTYPIELRLISSDPEGGFIIYKQQPNEFAYWSMKLAPETGYKQELVLDADWFYERSLIQNTPGTYFYFKINGRYGKGRLGTLRFPEGDYALELETEFQLQTDGSRNLDTGR